MSDIWFTSDTHFSHDRIRAYYPARAKFDSADAMREGMIDIWNSLVKPDDVIYHIGDFEYKGVDPLTIANRLNGIKILVAGNHDRKVIQSNQKFLDCFKEVHKDSYLETRIRGQHIVMCHFPIWEWHQCHRGSWHLHGHLHGNPHGIPGKILDVGADANNLRPWKFEEVAEFMETKPLRTHH